MQPLNGLFMFLGKKQSILNEANMSFLIWEIFNTCIKNLAASKDLVLEVCFCLEKFKVRILHVFEAQNWQKSIYSCFFVKI